MSPAENLHPSAGAARTILVGTDFSKSAENAIARAIRIAKDAGATLHVVHASSRLPRALAKALGLSSAALAGRRDDDAGAVALERPRARAIAEGVAARGHHVAGAATSVLRAKARELAADLIVVGARGRSVPDTFVGSTAERIAGSVRVPVLLVRTAPPRTYQEVVIAADASTHLEKAVAAAALVAPGRPFSVVHAYEGTFESTLRLQGASEANIRSYRRECRREAQAAMAARLADAGVDARALVLRHGDPRRVLRREQGIGRVLLVIERGRSMIAHGLMGSITRSVVEHGVADILIV
ncbi:MAG: universal stress protein [Labilithrix sp.]|nr:universal stress protein [Labilithrix sp.]MCW5812579.1 universal stress protein [Labilithrix sp.]